MIECNVWVNSIEVLSVIFATLDIRSWYKNSLSRYGLNSAQIDESIAYLFTFVNGMFYCTRKPIASETPKEGHCNAESIMQAIAYAYCNTMQGI